MACVTHQVIGGWLPLQAVQEERPEFTKKPNAPADGDLKLVHGTAVTDLPDCLQEVKPCKMAQGGLRAENLSIVSISLSAAVASHQTAFTVVGSTTSCHGSQSWPKPIYCIANAMSLRRHCNVNAISLHCQCQLRANVHCIMIAGPNHL